MSQPVCLVADLGRLDYRRSWELQRLLVERRRADAVPDLLLLTEHPPVYTLGRGARREHLLATPEVLRRLGTDVLEVDRGGDITYHGLGQLVGYPILDLRRWQSDPRRYLRRLEEVLIRTLAAWDVPAERVEGLTGVWIDEEKVAAIGVRLSHHVTSHGFALNVSTDLSYFAHIVPCGIRGRGVTSLERQVGRPVALAEVADGLVREFGGVFGLRMVRDTDAVIEGLLPLAAAAGGQSPI